MADEFESCKMDLDAHHDMVKELLPYGYAWPRDNKTTLQKYWRAFASMVKVVEDAACELTDEFFCDTADSTLPLWLEQYGLPDECDPHGAQLCARVAAQGGGTAEYFVEIAAALGYEVEVRDLSVDPPMADCAVADCSFLWPEPQIVGNGHDLDYIQPEDCPTPAVGTDLDLGTIGPDCCDLADWVEEKPIQPAASPVCDEPLDDFPDTQIFPMIGTAQTDCSGDVEFWLNGFAHHWEISIKIGADPFSATVCDDLAYADCACADEPIGRAVDQDLETTEYAMTDNALADCATTCEPDWQSVFCFIERYKPAHTTLHYSFH